MSEPTATVSNVRTIAFVYNQLTMGKTIRWARSSGQPGDRPWCRVFGHRFEYSLEYGHHPFIERQCARCYYSEVREYLDTGVTSDVGVISIVRAPTLSELLLELRDHAFIIGSDAAEEIAKFYSKPAPGIEATDPEESEIEFPQLAFVPAVPGPEPEEET